MKKVCPNCGGNVKYGNTFCGQQCSDANKLKVKKQEVIDLKKEVASLKQRITEQDNLWENLVGDLADDDIVSPAHIRLWTRKLVAEYNISNKNKMLGWLGEVADILDTYKNVKYS